MPSLAHVAVLRPSGYDGGFGVGVITRGAGVGAVARCVGPVGLTGTGPVGVFLLASGGPGGCVIGRRVDWTGVGVATPEPIGGVRT